MNETKPIYDIIMMEHANRELVYPTGKHSGFPDTGATNNVGFYYDLQDAINALHYNACDIREYVYDAAFILIRQPGLYMTCGPSERHYFVWDDDKRGFFEADEPLIFKHIAL